MDYPKDIIIHTIILIGGALFALGVIIYLFHTWSKPGCDHKFSERNALNPKCDHCGKRLLELIEEYKSKAQ